MEVYVGYGHSALPVELLSLSSAVPLRQLVDFYYSPTTFFCSTFLPILADVSQRAFASNCKQKLKISIETR